MVNNKNDITSFLQKIKPYYRILYGQLCGKPPFVYPWHYQWLSTNSVSKKIVEFLSFFPEGASVLDIGCGKSPYKPFLLPGSKYTGLDIETNSLYADIVVQDGDRWPIRDSSFECILCTQVLEHVQDTVMFLSEITRTLKPGGVMILSVPFLYGEHGRPWDYRRFTAEGITNFLSKDFEIVSQNKSGRIGSVIVTLFLNWIDDSLSLNKYLVILKAPLLPAWIVFSFLLNAFGAFLDRLDYTNTVYSDNIIVVKKKSQSV